MALEFRILGPLEAVHDGQVVPLKAAKPRALLALLLLQADELVASDRLIDDLWGGSPPATAAKTLQTYVSQLRRALGSDVILTRPGGYELRLDGRSLDLHRFAELASEAQSLDPPSAARVLREALALWRGPALGEFSYQAWAQHDIRRLEELRLDALERRIDADLATDARPQPLVAELELLVAEHQLRERLWEQLMLALYHSGRPADALAAYRAARKAFVDELGIEPGAALRDLERAILEQDPGLDAAKGTSRRVPTPPSLPERSTSFIGRVRELREIRDLVGRRDVRLLTLTGAAGTGKTRLAVEAAAGLVDALADGVVFVELAPIRDPKLVVGAILQALGLGETPGRQPEEVLLASLGDRQTVLVLDNLEQVLGAAPLMTEVLAGTREVTLLVTSRAPLDIPAERVYPVSALPVPDAVLAADVLRLRRVESVRLFVERATDARAEFVLSDANAGPIAELCTRLDGLPLALELAAARVKLLSPEAIITRLGPRLELLKAEPGSGAPERHRTLRAAIEWSYDLLDPHEQQLFTSLAVFVGGFTLDGAHAVGGDPERDVVDGVEALLRNNLVRAERIAGGEPRFGMLETIHEYARDRLEARGDGDRVRRLHARCFVPIAEAAERELLGPAQRTWLERLDADLGNLRAALAWATEAGEAETGVAIAAPLWRFWQLRRADREGREWLERLLEVPSVSEATRAVAESRLASLAFVQGDHDTVRRAGESSLPVLRRLGDDERAAGLLGVMATSSLAVGDGERARALAESALEVATRTGDPTFESFAVLSLGVVCAWHGELDEAERFVERSVLLASQTGNVRSVANWRRTLGGISLARGDRERARTLFEESLVLHRTLDDDWGVARAASRLALVLLEERRESEARQLVVESIELCREAGDRPGQTFNLEICAGLAAAGGQAERAVRLYACASVVREIIGTHAVEVGWPDHITHSAKLRAALGDEVFARAWEEGRAMSFEDALAYAIDED